MEKTKKSPFGRRSKSLNKKQIERLENFRIAQRWTLMRLKQAMSVPFTYQVLARAMEGKPIQELNHLALVEWLDRYIPAVPLPEDGKTRAAGGDDLEPPETAVEQAADDFGALGEPTRGRR